MAATQREARSEVGSVPARYDADPRSDVAFENLFFRYYWERLPETQ